MAFGTVKGSRSSALIRRALVGLEEPVPCRSRPWSAAPLSPATGGCRRLGELREKEDCGLEGESVSEGDEGWEDGRLKKERKE